MATKKYTVSIKFTEDFMDNYNKIKVFETNYVNNLIKVQAMPEKTDSNKTDKQLAMANLQEEFKDVSAIMFTTDKYDLRNFYEEVMLEFNTYAQHDAKTNTFIFEDTLSPMHVFSCVTKIYPKLLNYLTEYKLKSGNTVLVDYLKLIS